MKGELKIIFFGTSDFAVPILESLIANGYKPITVITTPDKPTGRKQILTPSPVKILAQKYNIPILQPEKIRDCKTEIENLKPDLGIIAAYGKILPKEILEIPKYGCLNVHPSILPKYRGPSPIQDAILNGEEETGISIILVDEKIDHGAIIATSKLKIKTSKPTYKELEKLLAEIGAKLLVDTISKWIEGKIKPQPQNESEATYTKILTKEDGKINWQKSAEEIERQIRAFNPEPGTYTSFQTDSKPKKLEILKIIKAEVLPIKINKMAGEIFLADDKKLAVACGKDALILEEVQPEGKRKMTGEEFLRGHQNIIGKTLN